MTNNTLLMLIDAIYAAAADPALWPTAAREIQRAIGGHSVNLILEDTVDARLNCIFSNGVTAAEVERYQREIMGRDELTELLNTIPPGRAFTSQAHFDLHDLHALYCYENFYESLGYTHFNAGLFYHDHQRRGWLSVTRSHLDPLFTLNQQMLMQALLPHLNRAFHINIQLLEAQLKSRIAMDSLEYISAAAALLNQQGRVVYHNQKAMPYLCKCGVAAGDVTLRLPDAKANRRLHIQIAAMSGLKGELDGGIETFLEQGINKTALCFPWRGSEQQCDWLGQVAHCIVFIVSPAAGPPRAKLMQQLFAISEAECRVLQQLLNGSRVCDIAKKLCISEATVRFHIRNLLHKTQTQSQTELLSRVFRTISVMVR
ncbi:helix-turn-helix transcriptional regulator [Oceanimonas marisflavi]|uniref:helix-turn-helix transcriptional regulator n=1 Tax=Oceanimonas marisflavi TaxID=2059724 RepID=UPI000D305296|nr:helix-turn-helix transcriptional regulator [Oceanimonas marisflavi]